MWIIFEFSIKKLLPKWVVVVCCYFAPRIKQLKLSELAVMTDKRTYICMYGRTDRQTGGRTGSGRLNGRAGRNSS